jgi:peroxiredoxin
MTFRIASLLVLGVVLLACGCGGSSSTSSGYSYGKYNYNGYGSGDIQFDDNAKANTAVEPGKLDLTFTDVEGNKVAVKDYQGKKHVVLVFMRGSTGGLCPYCSAQTSRLITNHQAFLDRDAVVLVVYPGSRERADEFIQHVGSMASVDRPPFPMLLDVEARVVAALGIEQDLAKPSTYIIDKQGQVRFAYVGNTLTDRPSIAAMLRELDALKSGTRGGGKS